MITDEAAIEMLHSRLAADDPTLTATEVVLLRSAFERLDDWLVWLDRHVALTHGSDASTTPVLQMLGGVRHKISRELDAVDAALGSVEP